MANPFVPQQRFSQDREGKILILVDFSNYNGIDPVSDDPYVNSLGNDDLISIDDFVERTWYLQDLKGKVKEAVFPYDLPQLNKCSIEVDRDQYQTVIMVIKTATTTYQCTTNLLTIRKAHYKLYVLSGQNSCCGKKYDQAKNDAANLINSAVFKNSIYDEQGADTDIIAANKLLDSFV